MRYMAVARAPGALYGLAKPAGLPRGAILPRSAPLRTQAPVQPLNRLESKLNTPLGEGQGDEQQRSQPSSAPPPPGEHASAGDWRRLRRMVHDLEAHRSHPVLPGELGFVEELEEPPAAEPTGPAAVEAARQALDRQLGGGGAAPSASAACAEDAAAAASGGEQPSTSGRPEAGAAGPLAAVWAAVEERLGLSTRTKGLILLNLLVILVSTNWVVVKDAGSHADPFAFAFLRFFVAAAAFSPFLLKSFGDRRILVAGAELGLYTAAGYILQAMGLLTTDASRASFLSTFTVLVVPFLAGLTPGRSVRPVTWAAAFAALLGVSLLEQAGTAPSLGDLWSFLSAVAFGFQVYRTEHWARKLGSGVSLPLMSVVLASTMILAGAAAVVHSPGDVLSVLEHPAADWKAMTDGSLPWLSVAYTGLVTTDLALMMELTALHDVPSTDAAIIYSLEPLLGASFAWVLLGERWGPAGWVGAGLIVGSSLVTQIFGRNDDDGPPRLADCKED